MIALLLLACADEPGDTGPSVAGDDSAGDDSAPPGDDTAPPGETRWSGDRGADDAVVITGVGAGDFTGEAIAGVGDLDADGFDDVLVGGYLWPGDESMRGVVWALNGPLAEDATVDAARARIVGEVDDDAVGDTLLALGDVDGDGHDDVAMASPRVGEVNPGAMYVFRGPLAGDLTVADAVGTIVCDTDGEAMGRSLAALGDHDGDGATEIAMGANGADRAGLAEAGAVYVVGAGLVGEHDTAGLPQVDGDERDSLFGTAVAGPGDLDGDGLGDLAASAYLADEGGTDHGVVYLVFGPVDARMTVAEADARLVGSAGQTGRGLAGLGDVDGDGHVDLGVGAPEADYVAAYGGSAYLVRGPFVGARSMDEADGRVDGTGRLGEAVLGPGDLDGDGEGDFLAGAPYVSDGNAIMNTGAVYLFYGGPRGIVSVDDADARWFGDSAELGLGRTLDAAGDTDGDGVPELLFGTQVTEAMSVLGGVWVVPGRP